MISNFLTKVVAGIAAIVLLILITACGILFWKLDSAEDKVAKLETQVSSMKAVLTKNEAELHSQEVAIEVLQKVDRTLSDKLREQSEIDKEIDNAPAEDDAETAPVLRRAIDGVDRMLRANQD